MNGACHLASVSNEEDISICGSDKNTGKLGSLKLVAKKEITDSKVRRVFELASQI
jgi:hypothetical protein